MKKPEIKVPDFKVPDFLKDLFSDLRDRRLLPLIGVLAIAIIAVPIALSKSTSPAGSSAPVAAGEQSGLTIVAGHPGLRDYRDRLTGDKAKDPFRQQYTSAVKTYDNVANQVQSQAGITDSTGGSSAGSSSGSTVTFGGSSDGSSSGSSSTDTGSSTSGGDSGSNGSSGGSDNGGAPTPPSPPDNGGNENSPPFVVSLRVGPPNDTHLLELSAPEALPSADNEIVAFRGLSSDGHKARFSVSPSVSAIFGDAKCVKGTDRCEVVEIERGLPVNFVYGPADKVYRVTVVEIQRNG